MNIFDIDITDANSTMYKAWASPDLFPKERQPVLQNWHPEDLVAFVGGGYAKSEYTKEGK